jgi:hypothetical protein
MSFNPIQTLISPQEIKDKNIYHKIYLKYPANQQFQSIWRGIQQNTRKTV